MKVLLTSPFMSYKDRWGQYYKGAGDTFPQGIGSIAGYLEKHDVDCDVMEPDVSGMMSGDFEEFLRKGMYDLVGVSAFTPNVVFAYETAKKIKATLPDCKVVVGGAHPAIFPERTLQECEEIDFLITQEGEIPMLELVKVLAYGKHNFETVPNLYFRRDCGIVKSTVDCEWLDLDGLPIFPYHKFDMGQYTPAPSLRMVLPTFNYMAQRGCPFSCSFCDTRTHGKKVRYRSVEKVIADLKYLKAEYGVRGIIFEGSNFTVNSVWIRKLCEQMIEEDLRLSWYCMGRVDLDVGLLPLMKKAGLWAMSFGIESANPDTLRRMRKRINPEDVRKTILRLRQLSIRSVGSFILGYPGEEKNDVLSTIEYACDLKLDVAVFFIPVPFPGTELHDHALEYGGMVKSETPWVDYSAWLDHNNPIYVNPLLGDEHVRLYNYAFRRFYGRPKYIFRQLVSVRRFHDVKVLLKGFSSVKDLMLKGFKK